MKKVVLACMFGLAIASTEVGEWWLPSKDELALIYKNQKDAVLASCMKRMHCSSSESNKNKGYWWLQYFGYDDS